MLKNILLALILVIGFQSIASNEQFLFRRISVADGLSNSWVRSAYQDRLGYMWFGTNDGINRFDGKSVKVYRPANDHNVPIGNVVVNDMLDADSESFWLCTEIGLFHFFKSDERIIRDPILPFHPVISSLRDSDSSVWFGSNRRLYRLSADLASKVHYQHNPAEEGSISDDYINTLFEDSKKNIWIGTKHGLNRYDKKTDKFVSFFISGEKKNEFVNDFTTLFEGPDGQMWVGTALDGLYIFTENAGIPVFRKIMDGQISSICADSQQRIWIGMASGGGIAVIDPNSVNSTKLSYVLLKNEPSDFHSLGDNSVFRFFTDRNKDMWILTYGDGVNFFSNRTKDFRIVSQRSRAEESIVDNLVNVFYEEDNYFWVGTEGGLSRLDKKSGKYKHYKYDPNDDQSLASNSVYAIMKDSKGNLWIGTWSGGLHRYNYKTDNFTRYLPDGTPGAIGSENVFSICEDSKENLWIGTVGGGLNRYDYNTGKFDKYIHNPNDPNSLIGRSMSHVYQTSRGDLLISMFNTLEKYNYQSDNFEHIVSHEVGAAPGSFEGNIQGVFEDSRGNIWITSVSGLRLFNPLDKTHRTYSTIDGLPDNTIQAILEDDKGNLWLSTNNGISKFINGIYAPQKPVFQNFSYLDGLPSNNFKRNAAYKSKQGEMYFGSSKGFVHFHPDSIKLNQQVPEIVFSSFLLLQTSPNANSQFKEISKNINDANKLELHYPNTDFTISFAALNYLNPSNNHYKYKLEGYDTEWIESGNENTATYTNLIEGKYTFMVMGANNDGIWNPIPRQLLIEIFPPWWRSTIFKIFTILFIILTLSFIVVSRIIILNREKSLLEAIIDKRTNELSKLNNLLETKQKIILEQNDELSKHRSNLELLVEDRTKQLAQARAKAEESDRLKSAFLANMSHEIRTPMNAIIGFSNLLVSDGLSEEKREKYCELIKSNSKSLFVLINDIIDISIIEANQLILSKSRFNVQSILLEVYNYFEMENKNRLVFKYENIGTFEDIYLYNDAVRFRQVIVNLLSNAFKYTDSGSISMGYVVEGGFIRFYVADTGAGIDTTDHEKVFDHFYKSTRDKVKLYRGTGIGLAICKRLVEQMEGKIWVESTLGKGSVFCFTLPNVENSPNENAS